MKLNTHQLLFANKFFEGNSLTIPFIMEVQTSSLAIEKYCVNHFSDLLRYEVFSVEQLHRLQQMKTYIKKSLSNGDINDMITILKNHGWLNNLDTNQKSIFQFQINETTMKMSSDVYPYMTVRGKIKINLQALISEYIRKGLLTPKLSDNKFVKEVLDLKFVQPLPTILTYERSFDIQQVILSIVTGFCNKQSSLSSAISKAVGIDSTYKFKKEVAWYGDGTIRVVINDFTNLLKAKAKKTWVPAAVAGVLMYTKSQRKQQKQVLMNQINVFDKMLQVAKEIDREEKKQQKTII